MGTTRHHGESTSGFSAIRRPRSRAVILNQHPTGQHAPWGMLPVACSTESHTMTAMRIPFEVFDLLEKRLGRDDAIALAKTIDTSLGHMEERSKAIAVQRKREIKDELPIELLGKIFGLIK